MRRGARGLFKEGTRAFGALCAFSHSATPLQRALERRQTLKPGLERLSATPTRLNVRRA